jgi:hypothetical protein
MKITSRTEIRVEKHEIRTIRVGNRSTSFCDTCGEETMTLTVEQLSSFMNIGVPGITRMIESSEIHFTSPDQRLGQICAASLAGDEKTPENKEK